MTRNSPGSGNTSNIGSIRSLSDLLANKPHFSSDVQVLILILRQYYTKKIVHRTRLPIPIAIFYLQSHNSTISMDESLAKLKGKY